MPPRRPGAAGTFAAIEIRRSDLSDRTEHELAALTLGEASPYPVRLLDVQCRTQTLFSHGTDLADRSRSCFSTFSFILAFEGTRRKEQMRMVATAQRAGLPNITRRCEHEIPPWSLSVLNLVPRQGCGQEASAKSRRFFALLIRDQDRFYGRWPCDNRLRF